MHVFPQKSWRPFFSCRPQNTGCQRRFTVKIKQIKRSDMVTFFILCSHYYRSEVIRRTRHGGARAWARAVDLPARSFNLARPGAAPPLAMLPRRHSVKELFHRRPHHKPSFWKVWRRLLFQICLSPVGFRLKSAGYGYPLMNVTT